MNRLWRLWLLMLVAIGALVAQVSTAQAATATANLAPGQLTISPASVTISYNVTRQSRGQALNSSFSVTVTDATGAKAGWQILAATAGTVGPQADFPIADHAIVDFNVSAAQGTWPDPTCPCGVIPTAFSTILQTPAKTGMGWSRVRFQTEFDVPADAAPGQYTTTLALVVAPLGTVGSMPGGRRPSTSPAPGASAPGPLPNGRPSSPASVGSTGANDPSPMPNARPLVTDPTTVPNAAGGGTAAQANTNAVTSVNTVQSVQPTATAAIQAAPAASATSAPSGNAAAAFAPANNAATATPVASAVTTAATTSQQPASSATSAPAVNAPQIPVQPANASGGGVTRSALPAVASAPAVTMNGETLTAQSAFLVDTRNHAANWNLQAALSTTNPTVDQPDDAIAMNLDVLDGDGGAPVNAQAWTLPFVAGPGALVNVAVPQGIGQATLLLNAQVHIPGGDPTHLAGAVLTITIVTGP